MKKITGLFCLFFLACYTAWGALDTQINDLIEASDPSLDVAVEVQTLEEGKSLFSRDAKRPYVTASTQKILTTSVAFAAAKNPSLVPGIDDSFEKRPFVTEFHYDDGKDESYLVFGGDPLLNLKDLEHIIALAKAKAMVGKKLHVVLGKKKDAPFLPGTSPGAPYEGVEYCYGSILFPAIVNQNRVTFSFDGGSGEEKASAVLDEGQPNFPIVNETWTQDKCFTDEAVGKWDQVQRTAVDFNGHQVTVKGCVSKDFKVTMCLPAQVWEVRPYLKAYVKEALSRNGLDTPVELVDSFEEEICGKAFDYASSDLDKLLKLSLRKSHNLVTDALFSKVTQKKEWPRNWHFASQVLKGHLESIFGVTFAEGESMECASGFSLYNRLSAFTMTQLLRAIHGKLGQVFLDLLPSPGEEGSLKKRLLDLEGVRILAKTGHLKHASNLAGYILREKGEDLAFTIFVTGTTPAEKRRQLVDDIVRLIAQVSH